MKEIEQQWAVGNNFTHSSIATKVICARDQKVNLKKKKARKKEN